MRDPNVNAEDGRGYKRQVAWLRPLLREARDLLHHWENHDYAWDEEKSGPRCPGCTLEERIDLYFDRFTEQSDGSGSADAD